MSERNLILHIECGDKTCYTEDKKPCKYLMKRRLGQEWFCKLFHVADEKGNPIPLEDTNRDGTGWLLREEKCLKLESSPANKEEWIDALKQDIFNHYGFLNKIEELLKLGEPRSYHKCVVCGESPDSGTHMCLGPGKHSYQDPRTIPIIKNLIEKGTKNDS